MTLAEKLKSIRKQAGMSQEQLAERLGVSRQAVTKWETDAGIPDVENVMALSALFTYVYLQDRNFNGQHKMVFG